MNAMRAQELIQQAMHDVPHALVGTSWWPRIEQASATLPVACHSIFLECHLSDEAGRTDLIARFMAAHRDAVPPGGISAFQLAEQFFERWANPTDSVHPMSFVDVEWDIGEQGAAPFVCPTLEPILWEGPRELEATRRQDEARHKPRRARVLARHVLEALYEDSVAEQLQARLGEAFDALPEYGCIHYVNYLPQRKGGSTAALRTIVSLPRRELRGYLAQLGFPGELSLACERMDRYSPFSPWANVDIDIGLEGLGSRLGIYNEFFRPRATDRVLSTFLERIDTDGLVPQGRVEALSAWVQEPRRSLTFKTVALSDDTLEVKAYLEIGPGAPGDRA